jgi:hypothetical protein
VPKRTNPPYQPTEADRTTVMVMMVAWIKQEDIGPCIGTDGSILRRCASTSRAR